MSLSTVATATSEMGCCCCLGCVTQLFISGHNSLLSKKMNKLSRSYVPSGAMLDMAFYILFASHIKNKKQNPHIIIITTRQKNKITYPSKLSQVHFHFLFVQSRCSAQTCSQASAPRSSPYRLCFVKDKFDPDLISESVLEISSSMSQGGVCSDMGRISLRGHTLLDLKNAYS